MEAYDTCLIDPQLKTGTPHPENIFGVYKIPEKFFN
jgi:hypothetical protein